MNRLATVILLLTNLGIGCNASSPHLARTVYRFSNITSSTSLTWTSCFGNFTCSRLQVPLDYANPSFGTTSIAFIKLAGKNATAQSPSIVLIPGGPGGSGVDLLLAYQNTVGQFLGEQYNFVSFDPRGVNNSGPILDCFSDNTKARQAFNMLHSTGTTNTSTASLSQQFYSSAIYGEWCNARAKNGSPHGYYVTTPSVARDLLAFVEAEAALVGKPQSEAKLWCYGLSYGTVVGTTFASLFPDRVGRMVLDGVLDAEQYYHNDWRDVLDQMDEAMATFSNHCHTAGPDKCSFWGATPENITARLDGIIAQLRDHPIPIAGIDTRHIPRLVTYSDLKAMFLSALYLPAIRFPLMADILHQVENGNASALAGMWETSVWITSDARMVIQCADSYSRNRLTTLEAFKEYVEYTTNKSKYIGDIYPLFIESILCRSFKPELPDSMLARDPISKPQRPTSFPVLFTSNTIDPLTPIKSARKMSSRFPGSVLLVQEAVGHVVVNQGGSRCYFGHVQAYLQGLVPAANITCPQQFTPFINGPF